MTKLKARKAGFEGDLKEVFKRFRTDHLELTEEIRRALREDDIPTTNRLLFQVDEILMEKGLDSSIFSG